MTETTKPKPTDDPDKGSGVCAPGEGKGEPTTPTAPANPPSGGN